MTTQSLKMSLRRLMSFRHHLDIFRQETSKRHLKSGF